MLESLSKQRKKQILSSSVIVYQSGNQSIHDDY